MGNYIALIRRADFIDLFKYGSLHLNNDLVKKISKSSTLIDIPLLDKKIFIDLTTYANAFESTFSYLFIHYTKHAGRGCDIHISDVKHIYPLDYEAKVEMSQAFDPRIRIEDPIWPDAVLELQKKHTLDGCKNGVMNLWRIYDLSDSLEEIELSFITSKVLEEVVEELYTNRHPQGELPIWVYAMRYERHAFYPSNTIGCFMDAVHVIFNFLQKDEVEAETIENTNIMQFLLHLNKSSFNGGKLKDVLEELSSEPSASPILKEAKHIEPRIDLLKCLSLFFIYRNRYKEDFRYEEDWAYSGKQNGLEFSIAAYMLGCILQHEHTYDCLYEKLPLAIFRKDIMQPESHKSTFVASDGQLSLFNNDNLLPIPIVRKKLPRARKDGVTATPKAKTKKQKK